MHAFNVKHALTDLNRPKGDALLAGIEGPLHEKQAELLRAIFIEKKRIVFGACARKFGKTEIAIYCAYRVALTTPNAVIFIVGPEKSHMARVYWNGGRLQRYLGDAGDKYISNIRYNEKSVEFKNGARIELVSSDNIAAANGLTPDFIIYDEFKDHNPRFHTDMGPNATAKGAPLLIIGTLPTYVNRNEVQYEAMYRICEKSPNCLVVAYTTFDNPLMNRPLQMEAIQHEIDVLRDMGDEATVQREYFSKRSKTSTRNIFPMFDTSKHVKTYDEIKEKFKEDWNMLDKWSILDPATKSTFGGLFLAFHPETKRILILDEIYEKVQLDMTITKIGRRILDKMKEIAPKDSPHWSWRKLMDNAAAREQLEMADRYPELIYGVTKKTLKNKQAGYDLIKDLLSNDMIYISDRCVNLIWEMQRYHLNDKGKVVKRDDHLVDCLRYFMVGSGYSSRAIAQAVKEYPEDWDNLKVGFNVDKDEHTWDVAPEESDDYGIGGEEW